MTFQSAPGLTVGRCGMDCDIGRAPAGFNPRPASRSGDATAETVRSVPEPVSIRARPHGRAMRHTCNLLIVLRSVTSFREPALRRNLVAMFCDG